MKIVLLGPPGSGKGTIAESLTDYFPNLVSISAGALLREEVQKGTTIGKEVANILGKGELVPTHFVAELIKLTVSSKDDYILDGFPRSLEQAKLIEDLPIDLVLYLDVPKEAILERFSGRRVDPVTKKSYHLKYIPPPDEIKDRLIQRDDDKPEVVERRFEVYDELTHPLVEFYEKKGILVKINALPLPEKVRKTVIEIIKKKFELK